MLIASIAANLVGILVFLFIFWKRLRDDYSPEIIFKSALDILGGILVGFLVSLSYLQGAFLWLMFLGALIGLALAIFRLRLKFYETFEALIISSFPWLGLTFLLDSVTHSSLSSFLAFVAILIFIFISYYLDAHYKAFTWYRSGKIGFAGIATLSLVFLTRSALAIFGTSVISFVGLRAEAVVSGAAAFICFILIFNLARIKD